MGSSGVFVYMGSVTLLYYLLGMHYGTATIIAIAIAIGLQ